MKSLNNPPRKLIVCITGMSGAGKSTVAEIASEMGFDRVSMGDIVRKEARRRGVDGDDSNLGKIMLELRETKGAGAIAELSVPAIERSKKSRVVVDGLRSTEELEVFKKVGEVLVISVISSPDRRKEFMMKRGRLDAPSDTASFGERESREGGVGVQGAMKIADIIIDNTNISIEQLKTKGATIFKELGALA